MTAREKQLLTILWKVWFELNTIRARDGVPYDHRGYKSSVSEEYFSSLVDECAEALGDLCKPWAPNIED